MCVLCIRKFIHLSSRNKDGKFIMNIDPVKSSWIQEDGFTAMKRKAFPLTISLRKKIVLKFKEKFSETWLSVRQQGQHMLNHRGNIDKTMLYINMYQIVLSRKYWYKTS